VFAQALGSVNAVAGVYWGSSNLLDDIAMRGSEFHRTPEVYGGIQGGLSNGEPVLLRTFFKPPATLGAHAKGGRHDPCVLPRAVPILEAMISISLADAWLQFLARPHAE
jgi:chorismate synthase